MRCNIANLAKETFIQLPKSEIHTGLPEKPPFPEIPFIKPPHPRINCHVKTPRWRFSLQNYWLWCFQNFDESVSIFISYSFIFYKNYPQMNYFTSHRLRFENFKSMSFNFLDNLCALYKLPMLYQISENINLTIMVRFWQQRWISLMLLL